MLVVPFLVPYKNKNVGGLFGLPSTTTLSPRNDYVTGRSATQYV